MSPFFAFYISGTRSPRLVQYEQALLALLIAAFLLLFVAQGYRVSGDCMEPHLDTGDRILVNKLAFTVHGPRRGDIVVFLFPRDTSQTFVKRVVGMPGDTISIQSGQVSVNGRVLPEPYRIYQAHGDMASHLITHGHYFVMGDNRDFSDDSRCWGDLPRQDLVGQAVVRYWPLGEYRWLK